MSLERSKSRKRTANSVWRTVVCERTLQVIDERRGSAGVNAREKRWGEPRSAVSISKSDLKSELKPTPPANPRNAHETHILDFLERSCSIWTMSAQADDGYDEQGPRSSGWVIVGICPQQSASV